MNDTSYIEPLSDGDFTELLIRHMIHCPAVFEKAKQLHVTGDDMVLDETYGNRVYKEIVNIINSVNVCPIDAMSIFNGLRRRFDDGILDSSIKGNTFEFLTYLFDDGRPLERPDFFDGKLTPFIKKRRAHKLIALYKDDLPLLTRELNKLNFDLNTDSEASRPRIVSPFSKLIYKIKTNLIGSGLSRIDEKIKGLLLGEFAIVVGFSGGGKTALGTNMVCNTAEMGTPSTYISCEEHEEELTQRFYAKAFRIRYDLLRCGMANYELETQFKADMYAAKVEKLSKNLCLIGMKGVGDITPEYLYQTLSRYYEEQGFVPQMVMLDQMQFISPSTDVAKSTQGWEIEKRVAAELDELSHRQIGGKSFVLWVQHQAKGKLKPSFSREDIDGFKGIIHKPDLVLGVGRENNKSNMIHVFSLKCRHCADFTQILRTEFEYMNVTSDLVTDTLDGVDRDISNPAMTPINYSPILPVNPITT
jgi:hypothetical protein